MLLNSSYDYKNTKTFFLKELTLYHDIHGKNVLKTLNKYYANDLGIKQIKTNNLELKKLKADEKYKATMLGISPDIVNTLEYNYFPNQKIIWIYGTLKNKNYVDDFKTIINQIYFLHVEMMVWIGMGNNPMVNDISFYYCCCSCINC